MDKSRIVQNLEGFEEVGLEVVLLEGFQATVLSLARVVHLTPVALLVSKLVESDIEQMIHSHIV